VVVATNLHRPKRKMNLADKNMYNIIYNDWFDEVVSSRNVLFSRFYVCPFFHDFPKLGERQFVLFRTL